MARETVLQNKNLNLRPTVRLPMPWHCRQGSQQFMGSPLVGTHGNPIPSTPQWQGQARLQVYKLQSTAPAAYRAVAPASYARTLLHLRWAAQSTKVLGSTALRCIEACELTLHSMKTTLLACAAQLHMRKEDRLAQGHHRCFTALRKPPHTTTGMHPHCRWVPPRTQHGTRSSGTATRSPLCSVGTAPTGTARSHGS